MPTEEQVWQSIVVGLIDAKLDAWRVRRTLSVPEVTDLLLDLRSAAAPQETQSAPV